MYRVSRTLPRKVLLHIHATRSISFNLPVITALETVKSTEQDFQGLFTANTINELWFKRGQQLVDGLNQSLEQANASRGSNGQESANNLLDIIAQTIQKPEHFGIYSYSSLLYNLQFFLESLKENPNGKIDVRGAQDLLRSQAVEFGNLPTDEALKSWLVDSFGSIEEFRNLILNSVKGIKGDGAVWLVAESNLSQNTLKQSPSIVEPGATKEPVYNNLAIVNTYNAGVVDDSLRSGQVNRLKLQKEAKVASLKSKRLERERIEKEEGVVEESVKTETLEEQAQEIDLLEQEIQKLTLGSTEEAEFNTLYNDKKLLPILAIDGSMRNYILDYGVFGKKQYLDNVWECIDWDVVSKRLPVRTKQFINSY